MASFDDNNNVIASQQFIDNKLSTDLLPCGESRISLNDRLYHMMKTTKVIVTETLPLSRFSQYSKVSLHRANAIRWMKDVSRLSKVSTETRDTSIQIFDRFLGICFSENKNIFGNSTDVSLAAAVSVLLSSKVHETRPLSMSSFSHLKISDMVAFEKLVLSKLGYCLFPSATPITFVRLLLNVWTENLGLHPILLFTANELISDFVEASEAPYFAPSTIALSALLLSFSKLDLDCTSWLSHVPNICLPSPNHPIYNSDLLLRFLDVDSCLSVFQRLQSNESNTTAIATTISNTNATGRTTAATTTTISSSSSSSTTTTKTIHMTSSTPIIDIHPHPTNNITSQCTISPNSICATPPSSSSTVSSSSTSTATSTSPTTTGCTVFSHSESDSSLSNLSMNTNIMLSVMDAKFIQISPSSTYYSTKSYNNNICHRNYPSNNNSNNNNELISKKIIDDRPPGKKSKNSHRNQIESFNTS